MYTLGSAPTMFQNLVTRSVAMRSPAVISPVATPPPITIKLKSPLMTKVIQKAIAARAGTEVRTGVPATLTNPLLLAAAQKALAAQRMKSIAPVAPSVLEQTGLNPPAAPAPTVSPTSPYSFAPDASGGGGGDTAPSPAVTAAPDVQEASMFPGDTTDQMAQVDQAAAAGDLSAQEVASIKSDLAAKTVNVPNVGTSWIPLVLLVGLIGVAVSQSRRTGGRIGRRGWGD